MRKLDGAARQFVTFKKGDITVSLPRMLPSVVRRAAGAAPVALVAAAATLSVTSAGSANATSAHAGPCTYLSDAGASLALSLPIGEKVQDSRVSSDLCVYRVPGRRSVAFVNVVTGKTLALHRFAEFLRLAGDRSQAIAGVGDAAYAIGPNVIALRGDTLIIASVGDAGATRSALRNASIELARSAAHSVIAVNGTCGKDNAPVREAAR